jgi:hypothetical protein
MKSVMGDDTSWLDGQDGSEKGGLVNSTIK